MIIILSHANLYKIYDENLWKEWLEELGLFQKNILNLAKLDRYKWYNNLLQRDL